MNKEFLEEIVVRVRGPNWRTKRNQKALFGSEHLAEEVSEKATQRSVTRQVHTDDYRNGYLPYIDSSGDLRISINGPTKYHWWNGGQTILQTLAELRASDEIVKKYSRPDQSTNLEEKDSHEQTDRK